MNFYKKDAKQKGLRIFNAENIYNDYYYSFK